MSLKDMIKSLSVNILMTETDYILDVFNLMKEMMCFVIIIMTADYYQHVC